MNCIHHGEIGEGREPGLEMGDLRLQSPEANREVIPEIGSPGFEPGIYEVVARGSIFELPALDSI